MERGTRDEPDYRAQIAAELLGTTTQPLASYFRVIDALLARGDAYIVQVEEPESIDPTPITHEDILLAASVLRDGPELTLDQACKKLGTKLGKKQSAQQLKLRILASTRAMLMLDCAGQGDSFSWQPEERFVDFVSKCLPKSLGVSASVKRAMEKQKAMKAWKLKARFHLSFRGTDNLSRHLHLDPLHPDGPTLYIFHYTAFLKAHLNRLQERGPKKEDDLLSCLQSGCLPARLIVETLHSILAILFNFDDDKSTSILERLIAKAGFDEDCTNSDGYKTSDDAKDLEYLYWGERLAVLHDFVLNPPPRNKFERWMQWQKSESNAFAVALAALLITIVVGILSLGLAAFQAWVAWKAWKDPVSTNGGDTITMSVQELIDLVQQLQGR
ncbi:hypothetical protein B0H67DRAFT_665098 [Lasiosphaeris hirsuta]|uniref:Uncharacterized protein n=1 Tax=Lasiosphaeris hirsuta TaxID=260670 RepID=A0AA40AG70_9PEZI|nr:hypothetical protein B0H67DRAFT_665098 [Lasiosphaeris hirsuta]